MDARAHSQSAGKTGRDKHREAGGKTGGDGRHREQDRNPEENPLASIEIGEPARNGRADDTAEQERTERPAKAQITELEMLDEERAGAGDDGDIKSKKQAAERSRGS